MIFSKVPFNSLLDAFKTENGPPSKVHTLIADSAVGLVEVVGEEDGHNFEQEADHE
jgi:hypothetical protein